MEFYPRCTSGKWHRVVFSIVLLGQHHKASFENLSDQSRQQSLQLRRTTSLGLCVVPKLLKLVKVKTIDCAHWHFNDWARAGELAGLLSPRWHLCWSQGHTWNSKSGSICMLSRLLSQYFFVCVFGDCVPVWSHTCSVIWAGLRLRAALLQALSAGTTGDCLWLVF